MRTEIPVNDQQDFDAMRGQMRQLKSDLERRELVDERLMRRVLARDSGYIRRFRNIQLFVLLPFIILSFLGLRAAFGLSWWFYGATVVLMSVCVGAETYINRLSEADYGSMPLLELMRRLECRRRQRRQMLLASLPAMALWLAWYLYELRDIPDFQVVMVGSIVGAVIGAVIGLVILLRMQRIDRRAIEDIMDV